ncbi:hypothetical protein Gohar_015590 [Gossypium harknessii]|uniref:Glycine-rich protein n=1 Tax=Gossypium harknessii TaxID=34285 RepID=A0A7J9G079_9ROSI|nr:hypothetical protein [Gossypium harknessii]
MAKCFMILALTFAVIHCSTAARNVPAGTGLDDQKNLVAFGGVGGFAGTGLGGGGGVGGGVGGLGGLGGGIGGLGGLGDSPGLGGLGGATGGLGGLGGGIGGLGSGIGGSGDCPEGGAGSLLHP